MLVVDPPEASVKETVGGLKKYLAYISADVRRRRVQFKMDKKIVKDV